VNGGLICFSNIIPKLYRLIQGTDLSFLTVVILSSGFIHNSYKKKKKNRIAVKADKDILVIQATKILILPVRKFLFIYTPSPIQFR